MMSTFRSFHISSSADKPLEQAPKAGDFVSARFSEDNEWYRARIRRNDRENKTAEVTYIDYGNSEMIPWSRLRTLDQSRFGVQKLRAQAMDAVFSFLQFPTSPEYLREAVNIITDSTADRQLVANVDYIDPREGTLYVTLFDPKQSASLNESVNADIITEGYAMVPKKLKTWERAAVDILDDLREREIDAKDNRRGQWEYGDLTED
jgi:staphylococcal nuclease domain-containing protein 1